MADRLVARLEEQLSNLRQLNSLVPEVGEAARADPAQGSEAEGSDVSEEDQELELHTPPN